MHGSTVPAASAGNLSHELATVDKDPPPLRRPSWMVAGIRHAKTHRLPPLFGPLLLVAAASLALLLAGASNAARADAAKTLVLYAVPADRAFVNNSDDRSRGLGNNPFGNYTTASAATQTSNEKLLGPFPGDEGLFTFDLYSDAAHGHAAGTALVICQYVFDKQSYCDTQYQLDGGTLVGQGPANADAKEFSFQITGGTAAYRGMTGDVSATLAGPTFIAPYLMLEPQRLVLNVHPASGKKKTTIYSLATKEQFVDNGDDEARGYASNPFHIRDKALAASENEDKSGPYPGDEAVFSFNVYSDSASKKPAGAAEFTCLYAFDRIAYCDAAYQLAGGTLVGGGAFTFDSDRFTLAITGGTGRYANMTGDVAATEAKGQSQQLALVLERR
jgi:hypothetical protein